MNTPGVPDLDLLVRSRSALLDALDALAEQRDSVVVIGAQAIYIRTESAPVAVAEATKDSDIAIDPRSLNDAPLIEAAMTDAGFSPDLVKNQPGAWLNSAGIPVDLMVPERLAGDGGKNARGARIPPHDKRAMRRARGLEAAVVDNDKLLVQSLAPDDARAYEVRVAGTASLVVAKVHEIGDRSADAPHRLVDKDAHDVHRILVATDTSQLAADFGLLLANEVSGEVTAHAISLLRELFAAGPEATGSAMAGRTVEGVDDPATVALQTSILASDLVAALDA